MGGGGGGGGAGDTTKGAAGARTPPDDGDTAEDVFAGVTFETTAAAVDGVEVTVCGWVNCM